ncbi:SGNH/GDSL hydrolase family protein [Ruegeria meonggei]|nr:SGNH/GDSL hydrolase family protein [Ruegeria meonggei]
MISRRVLSRTMKLLAYCSVMLLAVEVFARLVLGLGDPPLVRVDSNIEYRALPGEYKRFGNRVSYNTKSMRSRPIPQNPERHILIAGDSVLNGTSFVDHADLASTALDDSLPGTWVGNVSEGSWGPENLSNYFQEFGWFQADTLFVVFSTHDLWDLPRYCTQLGPDFVTERPLLAIVESVRKYGPKFIPALGGLARQESGCREPQNINVKGPRALRAFIDEARDHVDRVVVLLHPTRSELSTPLQNDRRFLLSVIAATGVEYVDMLPLLRGKEHLYFDTIHLTPEGQKEYFRAFQDLLRQPAND